MEFVYLQPIDSFFSGIFIRSSFLFKYNNEDKLDLNRFIKAMDQTLEPFNLMFSTFKTGENGKIGISYNTNKEKDLNSILEIENREKELIGNIDTNNFELILPTKIASKEAMNGYSIDLNNQKVICFKLTLFKDSFLIGYIFNHGVVDQSSVYYFFKYLSNCYTYGDGNKLKCPFFVNSTCLTNEDIIFRDLNDANEYHEQYLGFGEYVPLESLITTTNDSKLLEELTIQLKFDMDKLCEFKGNNLVSRNDIISACLLKIFSFNPILNNDDTYNFKYACNFRKFFNYDETAIGNYSVNKCIKISTKDLVDKDIMELALINRIHISKLNENDFKDSLSWFKFLQNRKENFLSYSKCLNKNSSILSNWTSFEYNTIKFDNTTPTSLLIPHEYAKINYNLLSFEYDSNNNYFYHIKISIPSSCLPKVIKLSEETNLFKVYQ